METLVVRRKDDMSEGSLQLRKQEGEGDIIISLFNKDEEHHRYTKNSIEFCLSGSRSKKTLDALHVLFEAMLEDQNNDPDFGWSSK